MKPLVAVALAAVALAMAGCGSNDSDRAAESPRTYAVGIDIPFHPLFAYVSAEQRKYFAGKPYRVRFTVLDTTNLVPAFGARKLDVIATFPSFLPRIEQRYGVVAREFVPLARINEGLAVWVPEKSKARSLEDLRGATVAAPPTGQQWGEEEAMVMAATGQSLRTYFDLRESAAAVQQLLLGRVEAAFVGGDAVAEVANVGGFRPVVDSSAIFREKYGDASVLSGGLVASEEFLRRSSGFVDDLTAAFDDAWRRYTANPRAVLEVASRQSGVPVSRLEGFAKAIGLSETPVSRRRITADDVATWTKIYGALARSGFLEREPDAPAKYFRTQE